MQRNYTTTCYATICILCNRRHSTHTKKKTKETKTKPLEHAHCFVSSILLLVFFLFLLLCCAFIDFFPLRCTTFCETCDGWCETSTHFLPIHRKFRWIIIFAFLFRIVLLCTFAWHMRDDKYQISFDHTHQNKTHSKCCNSFPIYFDCKSIFLLLLLTTEYHWSGAVVLPLWFWPVRDLPSRHPIYSKKHVFSLVFSSNITIRCTKINLSEWMNFVALYCFSLFARLLVESKINFTRLVTHWQTHEEKQISRSKSGVLHSIHNTHTVHHTIDKKKKKIVSPVFAIILICISFVQTEFVLPSWCVKCVRNMTFHKLYADYWSCMCYDWLISTHILSNAHFIRCFIHLFEIFFIVCTSRNKDFCEIKDLT